MLYSLSEALSPPEPSTFRSPGRPVTGQRKPASAPKRAASALSSGSRRSPRHPGTTGSPPTRPGRRLRPQPAAACSASRPTAVIVSLPSQLPRHGKPGVGLGDPQLSAPQVLLDVDVGPALFSVDLIVEWSCPVSVDTVVRRRGLLGGGGIRRQRVDGSQGSSGVVGGCRRPR